MNLGENIHRLRSQHHMSQGDLADALDVSRQSVSKWETGSAVPELEKLMKMSQLFHISLDELVSGEVSSAGQSLPPLTQTQTGIPRRKIAGTILFILAFLTCITFTAFNLDPLSGLLLALPFLMCGGICFLFCSRIGLWCAWSVYAWLYAFLCYATGTSTHTFWNLILHGLSFHIGGIVSLMEIVVNLLLLILTVRAFWHTDTPYNRPKLILLAGAWVLWLILCIPIRLPIDVRSLWYRIVVFSLDLVRQAGFVILVVFTSQLFLGKRNGR